MNIQECWFPLDGFQNLTSLELINVYAQDETLIVDRLARCLAQCPNLKHFGIGLGRDIDAELTYGPPVCNMDENFLESLCLRYDTFYGGLPLRLNSLRLGISASPTRSKESTHQGYLGRLVQTAKLRELDLFNGTYVPSSDPDTVLQTKIDFSLFDDCVCLTHFTITRLSFNVGFWLKNERRKSLQELTITFHLSEHTAAQDMPYILKLPNLSTLYVREFRSFSEDSADYDSTDEQLSETDSWATDDQSDLESLLDEDSSSTNVSVLDENRDGDPARPRSTLPKTTILDCLDDNGSHLSRLSLSVNFSTQWVCKLS